MTDVIALCGWSINAGNKVVKLLPHSEMSVHVLIVEYKYMLYNIVNSGTFNWQYINRFGYLYIANYNC